MTPIEDIQILAINLDRSADRLAAMARSAEYCNLDLKRISAVDGHRVSPDNWSGVSWLNFRLRNGREPLSGEYGCYKSHLKAIEQIARGDCGAGLIVEDDIEFRPDIIQRLRAMLASLPSTAVIKLVNHRSGGFLQIAQTEFGDALGVCTMGPQGSAAAYLVTRRAARRLLKRLSVMSMPFDVALERGWATGVGIFSVRKDVLPFAGNCRGDTLIATIEDYRRVKYKFWKRIPAFLFRAHDNNLRAIYALILWAYWCMRKN